MNTSLLKTFEELTLVFSLTVLQQMPWPVWNRDVVMLRSRFTEGDTEYQVFVSVEHPDVSTVHFLMDVELVMCFK